MVRCNCTVKPWSLHLCSKQRAARSAVEPCSLHLCDGATRCIVERREGLRHAFVRCSNTVHRGAQ